MLTWTPHTRTNQVSAAWKTGLCAEFYALAASLSSHSPNTCDWSGLHCWMAWRCELKCDCDCLLIIVRSVMDWRLVQGVSCLLPSAFWESIQPAVVTSNCIWNQHSSRLILSTGLILANRSYFIRIYWFQHQNLSIFQTYSPLKAKGQNIYEETSRRNNWKIKLQQDFLWSTGKY